MTDSLPPPMLLPSEAELTGKLLMKYLLQAETRCLQVAALEYLLGQARKEAGQFRVAGLEKDRIIRELRAKQAKKKPTKARKKRT